MTDIIKKKMSKKTFLKIMNKLHGLFTINCEGFRESNSFMNALEKRGVKFIGHLLGNNEFLPNIIEGKVLRRRGRGRKKKPYL